MIKPLIVKELRSLTELKKTERLWHIPLLTSFSVGIPLLTGFFLENLEAGILACLGGFVILYMPLKHMENRVITLVLCSVGFVLSFIIGSVFSFNYFISSAVLGVFAFSINWFVNYFRLAAPGIFFFIMIASMSGCMKFDLHNLASKVGCFTMGIIFACLLGFCYSLYITKKYTPSRGGIIYLKKGFVNFTESLTFGVFMAVSILIGHLFELSNPYWIPISCLAVMHGVSLRYTWHRSVHRMAGTLIGIGLTWVLLHFELTPLHICISIFILQFIVEMLMPRHYALAVIFITPLTLFLADLGNGGPNDVNRLILVRTCDITLGSLLGAMGGWILHNQQIHLKAERQIRKTRVVFLKKRFKRVSKIVS